MSGVETKAPKPTDPYLAAIQGLVLLEGTEIHGAWTDAGQTGAQVGFQGTTRMVVVLGDHYDSWIKVEQSDGMVRLLNVSKMTEIQLAKPAEVKS